MKRRKEKEAKKKKVQWDRRREEEWERGEGKEERIGRGTREQEGKEKEGKGEEEEGSQRLKGKENTSPWQLVLRGHTLLSKTSDFFSKPCDYVSADLGAATTATCPLPSSTLSFSASKCKHFPSSEGFENHNCWS